MPRQLKIHRDLTLLCTQLFAQPVAINDVETTFKQLHWQQYAKWQKTSPAHIFDDRANFSTNPPQTPRCIAFLLFQSHKEGHITDSEFAQLCTSALECGWNPLNDDSLWDASNISFSYQSSKTLLMLMSPRIFDDPKQPTLLTYVCYNHVVDPDVVAFVLQHTPEHVRDTSNTLPLLDIILNGDCDHFGHHLQIARSAQLLWDANVRNHGPNFFAQARQKMSHSDWDTQQQENFAQQFLQTLDHWEAEELRERLENNLSIEQRTRSTRKM